MRRVRHLYLLLSPGYSCMFFSLTNTGPHVHGSHEAIITEAAVLSGDVGALASITDVWALLALINV